MSIQERIQWASWTFLQGWVEITAQSDVETFVNCETEISFLLHSWTNPKKLFNFRDSSEWKILRRLKSFPSHWLHELVISSCPSSMGFSTKCKRNVKFTWQKMTKLRSKKFVTIRHLRNLTRVKRQFFFHPRSFEILIWFPAHLECFLWT